jgi:hypothetical protein
MPKKRNPIIAAHYVGIGKVIVAWARLEAHLITALEAVLKLRKADALVVFWHMAHKERAARLSSLFYLDHGDKNDPIRKEFETLTKRMEVAYAIRNMVAHGVWFKGSIPKSIKPFVLQARGTDVKFTGKGLNPEEFLPERLVKEAQKVDRLAADFREFFRAHYKTKFVYKG